MELHTLKPAPNATKASKRIGRGQGTGKGGTATKGHKGAQSRSGYSRRVGFEGGQNPLQRRIPKFSSLKKKTTAPRAIIDLKVLVGHAQKHKLTKIDPSNLVSTGLLKKAIYYKILGKADLASKLEVTANAFSQSAKEAIEQKGGTATIL